ncbi:DUF5317 domain-containing protein [Clostridium sp. D2Q-11]|uniref:DUF5317 domain-containing protein n=1 Tax=Anaeromonas frigoriresistens TaxID=2683708 RepID=A0A942V161_9FIRM|nr:DUF5317 domain-containing protein [Anaeromonas frigoriresistens]MBS4538127.1 DUF5317 domain-containing protein [Anaeromonas frigoriresistens]
MIWMFLIFAIIVGWLKGGKLRRLGNLDFRYLWMFIVALLLQYLIILFGGQDIKFISDYFTEIYIASYILLFIGIIINIKNRPLLIILVGSVLNFFVFIMNDGNIPVSLEGLKLAGMNEVVEIIQSGQLKLYTSLTETTKYGHLGQVISIHESFPFPQVFSIGDFIIGLGLFIFIESAMTSKGLDRRVDFGFGR